MGRVDFSEHNDALWMTTSLAAEPQSQRLLQVVTAALDAVAPAKAMRRWLRRDAAGLWCGSHCIARPEQSISVLAIGKAAVPMAQTMVELADALIDDGLVVTRTEQIAPCGGLTVLPGGHPWPDATSVAAAAALESRLQDWTDSTSVVVLLSGGASALLAAPWPGLTLDDLQATTDALLLAGVPIQEFNTVRKHLERFKGGRLAAALCGPVNSLILSDVIGSPLDVIGSGPTVPDSTTFADALAVVAGLEDRLPTRVLQHLKHGALGLIPETPKPAENLWERNFTQVIGSHHDAMLAAEQAARAQGWNVVMDPKAFAGEAQQVGKHLAQQLRHLAKQQRPIVLIAGGETTVTIKEPSRARNGGGRNQEMALAAAIELAGFANVAFLALATDGIDGPTPAAGAVATGDTLARAKSLGLDAAHALKHHQSFGFWQALGDAFLPGPTNTNVNDLVIAAAW